ncbi:YihY/virulence factor BrkB family protein [uncultured Clostridium sp.]|uniref:YihY/virulence factor BrkB family protein n=1 Tax=uncultured Clostridium sp. TaxID=59620 RepID=UPI0028EC09BD|nr:YihY/virulence factor BrkB family protein [uncultured Clostridium sp.]
MFKKIVINAKSLIKRILDDEVPALASQLSYSLLLSFFPFLIFLITLIGYAPVDSEFILIEMGKVLPTTAYELVHSTINEIFNTRNTNLMSFSIIFTIWTASSGFRSVIKGINKAYDEEEKRSLLRVSILSIISTLGLGFLIIITMLLLVFGQVLGAFLIYKLGLSKFYNSIWNIIRYSIILVSMIFIFALIYRYTPSRKLSWKEVIPGAIFTTLGWIITSFGFAFYVNNFANYSRLYGSIGAVIILLTWLYITSIIIIIGGEINALIAFDRSK